MAKRDIFMSHVWITCSYFWIQYDMSNLSKTRNQSHNNQETSLFLDSFIPDLIEVSLKSNRPIIVHNFILKKNGYVLII